MELSPNEAKLVAPRKHQAFAIRLTIGLLVLIALLTLFKACYSYKHANARAQKYSMSIHEIVHKKKVDISTLSQAGIDDRQYICRQYISIQKDVFVILISLISGLSFYGIHKWQLKYQEMCDRLARATQ